TRRPPMSAHSLSDFGAPPFTTGSTGVPPARKQSSPCNDEQAGETPALPVQEAAPARLLKRSARTVSAINGRSGSNIVVPPYPELIETNYVRPIAGHCMGEVCAFELAEALEEFDEEEILQTRRLLLRVF